MTLRNFLCWLTRHRLTEVISRPWFPLKEHCPGRHCRCGKRSTVILMDGTEVETTR